MNNRGISILELSNKDAKDFFMYNENYFTQKLPAYFEFRDLLKAVDDFTRKNEAKKHIKEAKKHNNVNHQLIINKDGAYAWRKLEIIHPFLYVYLVNVITKEDNWEDIKKRFEEFKNEKITCSSIPKNYQTKCKIILD